MSSLSFALSVFPVKIISEALDHPINLGKIHVPPDSGTTPLDVKAAASFAPSVMILISHPRARSMPYPAADPLIAAIVGVSRLCKTVGGVFRRSRFAGFLFSLVRLSVISLPLRSRPAQKNFPVPVMTIARISSSASDSMRSCESLASIGPEIVF